MKNFITPGNLSNEEIDILQKESNSSELSKGMKVRLQKSDTKNLFIQEHLAYQERSRNELSKKRMYRMFANIFSRMWMDIDTIQHEQKSPITQPSSIEEEIEKESTGTSVGVEHAIIQELCEEKNNTSEEGMTSENIEEQPNASNTMLRRYDADRVSAKQRAMLRSGIFSQNDRYRKTPLHPIYLTEPLDLNNTFEDLIQTFLTLEELEAYEYEYFWDNPDKEAAELNANAAIFQDYYTIRQQLGLEHLLKDAVTESVGVVAGEFPAITQEYFEVNSSRFWNELFPDILAICKKFFLHLQETIIRKLEKVDIADEQQRIWRTFT